MQKRPLGRTGLMVSPIAAGGAAFAYVHQTAGWDPTTPKGGKAVEAMLDHALDRGINYIDTAAAYGNGHSETLVGRVMARRRGDCVLASKVWADFSAEQVAASVEDSLRRLQTDHIDVMQLHGRMFGPADVAHVLDVSLPALLRLKEAGKIGHIGITSEEPYTLLPFLAHPEIEVYQIAYNLIYQASARHFLPAAAKAGVGVVTMRTMTSGILQRQMQVLASGAAMPDLYDLALKFVLADSRIASAIIGLRFAEEVDRNVVLASTFTPAEDFATLPRLTFEVYKAEDVRRDT